MTSPETPRSPRPPPSPVRAGLQDFPLLLAAVQDYAFITFDLDSRITGWSAGAERIFGYTETAILGQAGAVLFTPADRTRGEADKEVATAWRDGRAEDERWHLRRDGSCFWASGVLTLLRDAAGQPRGLAKVLRDLTERKRADERLRHSEERFRLFVENVRDHALFQVDPDGRIAGWNSGAEHLFGYPEAEILGQPFAVLFPPADRQQSYPEQELARTLAEGRVEDERWVVRRDGTSFWARWVTHPLSDDAGHHRGFVKVLRDETERRQAEEAREHQRHREREWLEQQVQVAGAELDRTKEELRALAASLLTAQEEERRRIARELHDNLAQRLATLEMGLTSLQQRPPEPAQVAARLAPLRQQVAALAEEVRRLSHRLHPSALEHLGLEAALHGLAEEFEQGHGLALGVVSSLPPRLVPLPTATALYRIAQEALRNVAKHAPEARVTLRVSHNPGWLHLTLTDDGPGFEPAVVRARGGLGLVSMQERAQGVGGTVVIRSGPGQGTDIQVSVPWPEE